MAKVVMNVRTSDIGQFNDNDILLYDKSKNEFYKTTADNFYKPYEIKLEELKKRYDENMAKMEAENQSIRKDNEEFKKLIKSDIRDLTELVKNFINTKGEQI